MNYKKLIILLSLVFLTSCDRISEYEPDEMETIEITKEDIGNKIKGIDNNDIDKEKEKVKEIEREKPEEIKEETKEIEKSEEIKTDKDKIKEDKEKDREKEKEKKVKEEIKKESKEEKIELPKEKPQEKAPIIEETKEIKPIKVESMAASNYPELNFGSPYNSDGTLSNEKMAWYFNRNKEHTPPTAQGKFDIRVFDGYYLGDTSKNVVYLTFDEGYENGNTSNILDVLKEKDVKATFFVTKPYITANNDLIFRMVEEGHIVGNHSVKHLSSPDLSDSDMIYEIEETERTFTELTGIEMPKFFRPPMGEYSARTLKITKDLGYKSIFWSFAYRDWLVDNQPSKAEAYQTIMNDLHNGSILLLHAVSHANTEALPDVIDSFRESGYSFNTLYDLPEYNLE